MVSVDVGGMEGLLRRAEERGEEDRKAGISIVPRIAAILFAYCFISR